MPGRGAVRRFCQLVFSCRLVMSVRFPGAVLSSVSVCCLVGACPSRPSTRLSFRPSARLGVSGLLHLVRSSRMIVSQGVSCLPVVLVSLSALALSVIAHRVRASSPRSRRRYRDGCLVLRRWASSLVSCSIHIRAVFPSSVSRRRWAWICPGSRCGMAWPSSFLHASSLLSLPCVFSRLVSASRSSARSSVRSSPRFGVSFHPIVLVCVAPVSFAWRGLVSSYSYAPFLSAQFPIGFSL